MPASFCGIVGLKPTWGLVPYTGIIGLDSSIDHVGPMAANVHDCALLLEVIAGADGLDDRQTNTNTHGRIKYSSELSQFPSSREIHRLLQGIRIGVLKEGFNLCCSDPLVDVTVLNAVERFRVLGAVVEHCSIPFHSHGQMIWGVATFAGSYRQSALGHAQGRKQVYMTDRIESSHVGQEEFDHANVGARNMMLSGMFMDKYYGPAVYARCKNLLRRLSVSCSARLLLGTMLGDLRGSG